MKYVHQAFVWTSVALGSLVGFAAESTTLAFYPFTDQTAGTVAAKNQAVANSVSESYAGAIKLVHTGTNPDGTATFDADVPGQYVYSDWTGTTLLTDKAQSLHFEGLNGAYGAGVSFYELADELYRMATEDDTDFTLEFFWKMPARNEAVTRELINNLALFNQKRGVCIGNVADGVNKQVRPYTDASVKSPSFNYPNSLFDGMWHHMAISFNHATKKFQYTLDYKVLENMEWSDEEPMTPPETKYVALGSFRHDVAEPKKIYASYITDIKIAAPRFSTGILKTEELLMAVNGPVTEKPVMPESGTVFLTTGVAGEQGTVLTSVRNEVYPMPEKMIDPEDLAARIYPVKNAKMPIADFSQFMALDAANLVAGLSGQQATVAVDAKGGYRLVSGETELVKEDIYSICTSPIKAGSGGAHLARGMALTYPDTTEEGNRSFTAEAILKWDIDNWKEQVDAYQGDSSRYYATMIAIPTTTNTATAVINLQAFVKDDDVTFALRTLGTDGAFAFRSFGQELTIPGAKWGQGFHRLALVYDETVPSATVYLDNNSYTVTLAGPLDFSVSDGWRFFDGLSAQAFTGWVDAVRITRGIVAPENFIRRRKNGGVVLIVR